MLDQGDEAISGGRLRLSAPTLVRLTSSRTSVPEGESLVFTAHVRTLPEHAPPPTGSMAFRAGHRMLGTVPLDATGTAVLDGVRLPAGVHAIVATYGGDARHAAASSTAIPQAVTAPLLPVVVAVATPVRRPEGVVLEAELLDAATGRLVDDASGCVLFSLDGVELADVVLRAGQARVVVPDLPPGVLVAAFAGEGEYAAASGTPPQSAVRS